MTTGSGSMRLFFRYFLPISILIVVMTATVARLEPERSITALRASHLDHVRVISGVAADELEIIVSDLLLLASSAHFRAFLDGDGLEGHSEVTDDLLRFSAGKKVFDQVRFLDDSGMEIIRVNYGDGNPYLVPPEELQPKGDRYYFRDTYSLDSTQVFVSPLDLNIELGVLERPLKLMIRFGIPVFDTRGRKRGIFLLNYLAERLTERIAAGESSIPGEIVLLNANGYWLRSPRPDEEFGFMYSDRGQMTFGNAFSEAWERISEEESGQFTNAQGLFTFSTIFPMQEAWRSSTGSREAFSPSAAQLSGDAVRWKVVVHVPSETLRTMQWQVGRWFVLLAVAFLMAAASASLLLAQSTQRGRELLRREEERDREQARERQEREMVRRDHERLQATSDAIPFGVLMVTEDGVIRHANQAALGMVGLESANEIEENFADVTYFPEETSDGPADDEAVSGATFEGRVLSKAGEPVPVLMSSTPIVIGGETLRLQSFVDVSGAKRAEAVMERMGYDLGERMKELTCLYRTSQLMSQTGVSASRVLQQTIELIPQSWQFPDIAHGRISVGQQLFQTKGFRETPWMQSSEITTSGRSAGVLEICYLEERDEAFEGPFLREERDLIDGLARDIGQFVGGNRARDAVNEMTLTLEMKVQKRTAELQAANRELEAFTHSVSHDLRAPLNVIYGFADMLEEDHAQNLDEEGVRLLRVVRDKADLMADLIDSLLALSRVGRAPVERTHLDMEDLVRSVVADIDTQFPDRSRKITVGALPPALADHSLIRQLWVNLLSNAVKFSAKRRSPRIAIQSSMEEGESVYSVEDNGAGFDMNFAEKLFGVFERLHSSEEFEGTGVGLSIVKRIVERHGGRAWAEGKVGKGATFHFTLPDSGDFAESGG